MTKKEYCLTHEPTAAHDYYCIYIHGIEYSISDYAYISEIYQPEYCGKKSVRFHKIKIYCDYSGNSYVILNNYTYDGKRKKLYLSLNNFIRKDSGWCVYTPSCDDLKNICGGFC